MPDRDPGPDQWRKSSFSVDSGACVEWSFRDGQVHLRHSRLPEGATLTFTVAEWRAFVAGVRDNEFELPASFID